MRRLLVILFTLMVGVLGAAPSPAFAQPAPQAAINSDVVTKTFQAMREKIDGLSGKLKPSGQSLLRALGLLVVAQFILKVLLEGDDFMSQVATLINAILMYGILSETMTQYGTGGWLDLATLMRATATTVTSNLIPAAGEADYVWLGVYDAINAGKMFAEALGKNYFEGADALAAIGTFFQNIWMIIFGFFTVFILIIAGVVMAATYTLSQFMVGIGIIMGPIMIPWLLWSPTQFLFDGWMKFMLSAVMTAIVGPVAGTIGAAGMSVLLQDGVGLPGPNNWLNSFVAPLVILLISVFILYLMMNISSIAQGLMSGNGALGFQMHRVAKGLTAATSALKSTAAAGASAASAGASAGGRAAVGMAQAGAAGAGATRGVLDGMRKGYEASSSTGGARPSALEGSRRAAAGGMAAIAKGVRGATSAASAGIRSGASQMTAGVRSTATSIQNASRAAHAVAKRTTRQSIK